MKNYYGFIFGMFAILSLAGCSVLSPEEHYPVALSIDNVEQNMRKALDPESHYATSNTYIQRQVVTTEHFMDDPEEQLVEIKFRRPDSFKITEFEDNQPKSAILYDGENGYVIDYNKRKVTTLEGPALEQIKTLAIIATPESSLHKVFSKIDITGCRVNGKNYLRLSCYGNRDLKHPFQFYLDEKTFLPEKITARLSGKGYDLEYASNIVRYALQDGVMIPMETQTEQNGVKQTTRVVYYKLNAQFGDQEFKVPVFGK